VGMVSKQRTAACGSTEARARLRTAQAYLEVAEVVLVEPEREEFASVAAGLAVLSGIAASDAICCVRLGKRHRGEDHHGATVLLEEATPDGSALAITFTRLLELKNTAHYGATLVSARSAASAVKWAGRLVERAREEVER